MNLERAKRISQKASFVLEDYCEAGFLWIAGSIRRQAPEVGDIEIVCLPLRQRLKDMFGWDEGIWTDPGFGKAVESLGKIVRGGPEGKYCKVELPEGISLDLFMPSKEDFFRILAIRTGSAEYSHKEIASAWRRKGWVGTPEGLRLMKECDEFFNEKSGKTTWRCRIKNKPTLPPVWKSEEEFFAWLDIPWISPQFREIQRVTE